LTQPTGSVWRRSSTRPVCRPATKAVLTKTIRRTPGQSELAASTRHVPSVFTARASGSGREKVVSAAMWIHDLSCAALPRGHVERQPLLCEIAEGRPHARAERTERCG
jgi:hypothetical protein